MEIAGFLASCLVWKKCMQYHSCAEDDKAEDNLKLERAPLSAYENLVGNTPLVKLRKASELTGCNIMVKMECMNPGKIGLSEI